MTAKGDEGLFNPIIKTGKKKHNAEFTNQPKINSLTKLNDNITKNE